MRWSWIFNSFPFSIIQCDHRMLNISFSTFITVIVWFEEISIKRFLKACGDAFASYSQLSDKVRSRGLRKFEDNELQELSHESHLMNQLFLDVCKRYELTENSISKRFKVGVSLLVGEKKKSFCVAYCDWRWSAKSYVLIQESYPHRHRIRIFMDIKFRCAYGGISNA